ncbi:MAG: ABC transporter ATP-binding protein [Nitrososphaeria archaeon]|nr:ABC transporter ATP-binding protein [Nitrososphaeria archaeon]
MARVTLKDITKKFGNTLALNKITLDIKDSEFFCLLGPSGAGKTTLLRIIAGVETPTLGEIFFNGKLMNDIPPKDRNVSMMFQSYALFPHMTVYDNIAYPLRKRKISDQEIRKTVENVMDILRIKHLLNRLPRQLSGGERQRVALGRALVVRPEVLLLDEPLTNLDAKLRIEMRGEFKRISKELNTTIIYATPDQAEAMSMADRIAVMNQGILQQVGTPDELYNNPRNLFVAGFIGSPAMNMINCTLIEEHENTYLDAGEFKYKLPRLMVETIKRQMSSRELILGVRPEDIAISLESQENAVKMKVYAYEALKPDAVIDLKVGEGLIKALVSADLKFNPGDVVLCTFKKFYIYDKKTSQLITSGGGVHG